MKLKNTVFGYRCSLWLPVTGHALHSLLHLLDSPTWDALQALDWWCSHWLPGSSHTWEELDRVCTWLHHQAVVHIHLQCWNKNSAFIIPEPFTASKCNEVSLDSLPYQNVCLIHLLILSYLCLISKMSSLHAQTFQLMSLFLLFKWLLIYIPHAQSQLSSLPVNHLSNTATVWSVFLHHILKVQHFNLGLEFNHEIFHGLSLG